MKKAERIHQQTTESFPALYWAENDHVNTRGESMDFRQLDYLMRLYQEIKYADHMVVEKSVQCGLSELFIIQSHIEAGELGLSVMYVLPKYELRNRFVNNRIYKLHKRVDRYDQMVQQAETTVHRTSLMHFGKGTLVYVGSNVESEFIEVPIDSAYVDEKDRCNQGNLLMLPDRLTASPYKFEREISNPTVEDFGIDARYKESSQAVWMIQCDHCGKYFNPDFWKHVVRQVGHNQYAFRDPDYEEGSKIDARLMHNCGAPVDRLKCGHWMHKYPNRMWRGYRVSKVFSKFARLGDLGEKYMKAVGNDLKTQLFYNSDLGLPYSSKGAKVTREMLDDCRREYTWPVQKTDPDKIRVMGVDVGTVLHVVMRERYRFKGGIAMKLIMAQTVPGFSGLAKIIREWKPKRVVIDAEPERHKVSELKSEFHFVWSMRFQETNPEITRNKQNREARMNRTALLDYVRQGYDDQDLWLPVEAGDIDNGEYYAQLMASTRILQQDDESMDTGRFVWVHTRPDHYFLAEAYCMAANLIMPAHDVFEFYSDEADTMNRRVVRNVVKSGETIEEKEEIDRLKHLIPETFVATLQDNYAKPTAVKPAVNYDEIWALCEDMIGSQGYVDIHLIAKMANEHEDDVKNVVMIHDMKESKIRGQYVTKG